MKGSIIKTLLYGDLEEIKSIKSFCFYILRMIICVGGIVYFISSSHLMNDISVPFYFSAIALGTYVYSFLFILSSFLYNKKVVLFNVLPIKKEEVYLYIWIDLLIEIFITKFLPLLIGISSYLVYQGSMTGYECIEETIKGLFVFISFSALSFIMVIYLGVGKKIRAGISLCVTGTLFFFVSLYEHSLLVDVVVTITLCFISYLIFRIYYVNLIVKRTNKRKLSNGLLQREFSMFFGDKILVSNFIVSNVFSFVFVINLILNKIHLNFMVAIMTLLPLFSVTTFSLYSYEGDRIKLIDSLPLKKVTVFLNKYILSLTITLFAVSTISAVLFATHVIKVDFIILYVLSTIFICAEKILLDMTAPCLEFSHTEELLRNSRKYKMYLTGVIGYVPLILLDTKVPLALLCLLSCIINGCIIASLVHILRNGHTIR